MRTSVEAESGRNGRVSATHRARGPEPDALGPREHTVKPRDCRAAHVYQGRWLDFLLAVYSLEACEGPSIV